MVELFLIKVKIKIIRQRVINRKVNKVEMPTITVVVNNESVDDNSKEEMDDDDLVNYDGKFWMQ